MDSFKINVDSLCYKCNGLEQRDSIITGIGNYCRNWRSEYAGNCVGSGLMREHFEFNGCKGFEEKKIGG